MSDAEIGEAFTVTTPTRLVRAPPGCVQFIDTTYYNQADRLLLGETNVPQTL